MIARLALLLLALASPASAAEWVEVSVHTPARDTVVVDGAFGFPPWKKPPETRLIGDSLLIAYDSLLVLRYRWDQGDTIRSAIFSQPDASSALLRPSAGETVKGYVSISTDPAIAWHGGSTFTAYLVQDGMVGPRGNWLTIAPVFRDTLYGVRGGNLWFRGGQGRFAWATWTGQARRHGPPLQIWHQERIQDEFCAPMIRIFGYYVVGGARRTECP